MASSFKYEVFLSFSGEDTRKTFVDHLYHALESRGIITYKDDEKIEKGKRISDELMRSIEDSKFYIIVFSKNYASSSWCLDELVKIMECQRMNEHTVYPLFYDVEPTEIRKQSGSVGVAFARHENKEAVEKWRVAMREAADLAGWELEKTVNGHEAKFIQNIVEEILLKLRCTDFRIDGKLVGMEARVKDVLSSLEMGVDDVHMIGIWGMGGAGKTTLAKSIFDQISILFEGSSFVDNVREISNDPSKGFKSLQNQVLSDVLNDQGISVKSDSDMKKMLRGRKVLVVLDDVDHINQLEALAGEPNWFKPGSRIIITTRDKKVLVAHKVKFNLEVNLLSEKEAICLFSRYAFGKDIPIQGYEELCREVLRYAAGLPLTLKVLGSLLCGESDDVWRDVLKKLKTIPLAETQEVLEISYKCLDDEYKEIFLDVACMLKGWEKGEAIRALESCGFHAKIGFRVLEQKSLITISDDGYLGMHDHIEEMGMNIVRRLHPNEPHKHSRLWKRQEIEDILAKDEGTEATRSIYLVNPELHPATIIEGITKMKGLRFLYINRWDSMKKANSSQYGAYWAIRTHMQRLAIHSSMENGCLTYLCHIGKISYLVWKNQFRSWTYHLPYWQHSLYLFPENSEHILDGLQYLHWENYLLTCLPNKFLLQNVVQLQMHSNNIRQLWKRGERKVLHKLTYIDLSDSCELRTLDLRPTPNLETLILSGCSNLVELHMHSENPKLKFLDLSYSKLRTLDLGPHPNLEKLIINPSYNLVELHMHDETPKLKFLDLRCCFYLRIVHLGRSPNLEVLSLNNCHDLEELHMPVGSVKLVVGKRNQRRYRISKI